MQAEKYRPVDEQIEHECPDMNVGKRFVQKVPKDTLDEYDLCDTYVDVVINQGDVGFFLPDAHIDPQGRLTLPAKNCKLHGLDKSGRMSVFFDRVTHRRTDK